MNAPDKIFVGITDGKHYSIVGEGYPYAKEYVSIRALFGLIENFEKNYIETDRGRLIMTALQVELKNRFGNAED